MTNHEQFKKFPIAPHHEVDETFADQLCIAMFDGATLRLDFAVARMEEPAPPKLPTGERHIVCRLVLSAPCAIDLINRMQQVAGQLTQAGLIKLEPGQPPRTEKTS